MVRVDGNGNSSLIQVRGLDKKYQRGSEEIHVLQGLNLDVEKGEFVAFMGPSGSGKTTLLNLQNDAFEPAWRSGCAYRGQHHRGGRRDYPHVAQQADELAGQARRLCLPGFQSDSGADRLPKRGIAAPADKT